MRIYYFLYINLFEKNIFQTNKIYINIKKYVSELSIKIVFRLNLFIYFVIFIYFKLYLILR